MIRNPIYRLADPIVLADIKKSIPIMYRHFFEVSFSYQVESKLRQHDTVKITIATTDNLPSPVDKETAVQRAKELVSKRSLFDVKMSKARHVRTQRADSL